jgi:hypothetical protein
MIFGPFWFDYKRSPRNGETDEQDSSQEEVAVNINNPDLPKFISMMHHERFEKAYSPNPLKLSRINRSKTLDNLSQMPGSATDALSLGRLSALTSRTVRAYWWVPAGFAVLVLVRSILGG